MADKMTIYSPTTVKGLTQKTANNIYLYNLLKTKKNQKLFINNIY